MMKKLLLAAMVAASLGAVAPATSAATVYVQVAPPPAREEVMPQPRRGYAWVPGYWNWRNHQHVWVGGRWMRERPGYRYQGPQWREHEGRWMIERGRWSRGDRDGDGVPNRMDRRPDDPTRR